jgi:hypothetical protein
MNIIPPKVIPQPIFLKVQPEALPIFLAILLSLMVVVGYLASRIESREENHLHLL